MPMSNNEESVENIQTAATANLCEDAMKMMDQLKLNVEDELHLESACVNLDNLKVEACKKCCCNSHCRFSLHANKSSGPKIKMMSWTALIEENSFPLNEYLQEEPYFGDDMPDELMDPLSTMMLAVNMDLDY